jgi:serine phosphatase RsbU (regulator of sigma subunit)
VHQLDAASGAQVRLADARAQLDELLATQLAEETGVRGYASTKDPQFLENDKPPDPNFDRIALALESGLRIAALPGAPRTVEDMRALHLQWEQEVALPLMRNPGSHDAYVQESQGKFLTDALSRDADKVAAALDAQAQGVQQALRRQINLTFGTSAGVVTLFALLALSAAIGRANTMTRLVREQSLVDALQRTLRVRGQHIARTQMAFSYASATREALIGGDLLDAWRGAPDRGWILIADASGKGIEAARHAAFAQYAVRALAADANDPAEVVTKFNRLFLDTIDDPQAFIVLFLASFESATRTLRYASAGHPTAYVRRGNAVDALPPTGSIVGIERDSAYTSATVQLADDDLVLLATDGLSEARNAAGELLGEERIAALIREAPADPQAVCDLLVVSADAYSGGVQDDLAILALRVIDQAGSDAPFDAVATGHATG